MIFDAKYRNVQSLAELRYAANQVIDEHDHRPIQDIIIRGGENLYPAQIENVLTSNPSVLEAAVVSVPDEKYGEVVGAWIRPRADAKLSRESVKKMVWESMNPQVCICCNLGTRC